MHSLVPVEKESRARKLEGRLEDSESERRRSRGRQARWAREEVIGFDQEKRCAQEACDLGRDMTLFAAARKNRVDDSLRAALRRDEHVALGQISLQGQPASQSRVVASRHDGEPVYGQPPLANSPCLLESHPGDGSFARSDCEVRMALGKRIAGDESTTEHSDPDCRRDLGQVLEKAGKDADFGKVGGRDGERALGLRRIDGLAWQEDVAKPSKRVAKGRFQCLRFGGEHQIVASMDEQGVAEELAKAGESMTDRRLRHAQASSRPGYAANLQQRVERQQEVQIEALEIERRVFVSSHESARCSHTVTSTARSDQATVRTQLLLHRKRQEASSKPDPSLRCIGT